MTKPVLEAKNEVRRNESSDTIRLLDEEQPSRKDCLMESADGTECESDSSADSEIHEFEDDFVPLPSNYTPVFSSPTGRRFNLLTEGDVQIIHLDYKTTIASKILSFKFLRRWEVHRLYANDSSLFSKTPIGYMESPIEYTSIQNAYEVVRWDGIKKNVIRLIVPNGSYLILTRSNHLRNQWLHTIHWRMNLWKYQKILRGSTKPAMILSELKSMVEYVRASVLKDDQVTSVVMGIVSRLLNEVGDWKGMQWSESLIECLAPLLESFPPSVEMIHLFAKHCELYPRSTLIQHKLIPAVHYVLKHNVDFGRCLISRTFIKEFIKALGSLDNSDQVIEKFVVGVHGRNCECPHPRVLTNLACVCLTGIFSGFENFKIVPQNGFKKFSSKEEIPPPDPVSEYGCYLKVLSVASDFNDWLPGLSLLLQPIPIPPCAFECRHFVDTMMLIVEKFSTDPRCDVHQCVLGVRPMKDGWFDLFCPTKSICNDGGRLWSLMLKTLLTCCGRRKSVLQDLYDNKFEACMSRALNDDCAAQSALCLMLEWQLSNVIDRQNYITTVLLSTESGSYHYDELCKQMRQEGGPLALVMPNKSVDLDLKMHLRNGYFGNLESLTLAFTNVTSSCSDMIIKLPSLKYLNLWSTQFGDSGLIMISEHMDKLISLNLCETPVSDKGIMAITSLTNLKWLNLTSTKLSSYTLEMIKRKLPHLNTLDIRYTEAW